MKKIELIQADITRLQVDAIVNAANSSLLGGGGVDGAIHRAAGPELLEECKTLNGCPTGKARITKGYQLPARYVVHTVGPIWNGGERKEEQLLASCYRNSLSIAIEHGINTIAFPNISTGVYRYPKTEAAEIAIREVTAFLKQHPAINRVIFAVFDEENFQIYSEKLSQE